MIAWVDSDGTRFISSSGSWALLVFSGSVSTSSISGGVVSDCSISRLYVFMKSGDDNAFGLMPSKSSAPSASLVSKWVSIIWMQSSELSNNSEDMLWCCDYFNVTVMRHGSERRWRAAQMEWSAYRLRIQGRTALWPSMLCHEGREDDAVSGIWAVQELGAQSVRSGGRGG